MRPRHHSLSPLQTSKVRRGIIDVNNSPVADYMQFPGLYPNVAGKVASNGPYKSVRDVFAAAPLTGTEKERLKKYEPYLVAYKPDLLLDPMRGRDPYRAAFNDEPVRARF